MLARFLHSARRVALSIPSTASHVRLVLGNEAADADSIVGAVCQAYAAQLSLPPAADVAYVPCVACSRDDFVLRREAAFMLARALGDADPARLLTFQEELDVPALAALAAAGKLQLVLVDHNKLTGPLAAAGLGDCVTSIVDHHKDMGAHPGVTGDARRISFDVAAGRGVGSSCTLIADTLLRLAAGTASTATASVAAAASGGADTPAAAAAAALAGGCGAVLDSATARLLLGVILLDTIHFDPAANKTTAEDTAVAGQLVEWIGAHQFAADGSMAVSAGAAPAVDTLALFKELNALREDPAWWGELSPLQALRFDYKVFECALPARAFPSSSSASASASAASAAAPRVIRYGIASIGEHVTDFLSRPLPSASATAVTAAATAASVSAGSAAAATVAADAGVLSTCAAFAAQQQLSFLGIMSRVGKRRQACFLQPPVASPTTTSDAAASVVSPDEFRRLLAALADPSCSLRLQELPLIVAPGAAASGPPPLPVAAYEQGNFACSRKQLVPLLDELLPRLLA